MALVGVVLIGVLATNDQARAFAACHIQNTVAGLPSALGGGGGNDDATTCLQKTTAASYPVYATPMTSPCYADYTPGPLSISSICCGQAGKHNRKDLDRSKSCPTWRRQCQGYTANVGMGVCVATDTDSEQPPTSPTPAPLATPPVTYDTSCRKAYSSGTWAPSATPVVPGVPYGMNDTQHGDHLYFNSAGYSHCRNGQGNKWGTKLQTPAELKHVYTSGNNTCPYRMFSTEEARECLRGKWIHMSGDSLVRDQFFGRLAGCVFFFVIRGVHDRVHRCVGLCWFIDAHIEITAAPLTFSHQTAPHAVHVPASYSYPSYCTCNRSPTDLLELVGAQKPCSRIKSHEDHKFVIPELDLWITQHFVMSTRFGGNCDTPLWANLKTTEKPQPDVLVWSSGLWFFPGAKYSEPAQYRERLECTAAHLKPGMVGILRTTTPYAPAIEPNDELHDRQNMVAKEVLVDKNGWGLLDAWSMMKPRLELTMDGIHFSGAGSKWITNTLLNEICLP